MEAEQTPRELSDALRRVRLRLDESKTRCQFELAIELRHRSHRDPKEAPNLARTGPTRPFSNIGRDGDGRRSHLRCQPITLPGWEVLGESVNSDSDLNTLLPHLELAKVVHLFFISTRSGPALEPPCRQLPFRSKYQVPSTKYLFIGESQ